VPLLEVKAVSRESFPEDVSREMSDYRPEEQVHPEKLKKVARTAELYIAHTRDERDFQIGVVGVFLNMKTRQARGRCWSGCYKGQMMSFIA
jgi:Holliday junction resolvase-like predicted endonuclease